MTSAEQLIDALERAPDIVIPLIRQADPVVLKRRPPTGKWSIHEHACHLPIADELFLRRIDLFRSQDKTVIESYDPGRDEPDDALMWIDLDEALGRYRTLRQELVDKLRHLSAADWAKTADHDEYNSYSMYIMMRHLALHDFFHAYRIEELMLRKDWPRPLPMQDEYAGNH